MKRTLVFFAVIVLLGVIGVFRTTALRQDQTNESVVNKQAEKDAARKIHKGLGGGRKTIPEEALEAKGDLEKRLEVGLPVLVPNGTPFTTERYLSERACAADSIFIGVVKDKRSELTEDQTFVFSNYGFSIETVIKNESGIELSPNSTVNVSRLGGDIKVHGRHVKAISEAASLLQIGKRYLLFVTFLREHNTFAANNLVFVLQGGNVLKLDPNPLSVNSYHADSFLIEVRKAAASQCITEGSVQ